MKENNEAGKPQAEMTSSASFLERIVSLLRERTGITNEELSDKDLLAAYDKSLTLAYVRVAIGCQDFSRAVSTAYQIDKDKFKKDLAKFTKLAKQR